MPPSATATVSTPAVPQRPDTYLWRVLDAALTVEELDQLAAHAAAHGYAPAPDGKLQAAIAEKRASLAAPAPEA